MGTVDRTGFRIYNSRLECGLRALIVLKQIAPRSLDLQRLVYYDYLLAHSSDVEGGPNSLHPPTPYRSSEWVVRREAMQSGLDLMFAKELLSRDNTPAGLYYRATELTGPFLARLKSPYASAAAECVEWVHSEFGEMSDSKLAEFMHTNVGRWGAEFTGEALMRGHDHG